MPQGIQRFVSPPGFTESSGFPDLDVNHDLNSENQLFLIQTPWNFDISQLNGIEIPLKGKHEIEIDSNKNIAIEVSKSSKPLENISLVTKTKNNRCVVSGKLSFKRQINISESYNFPRAVVPDIVCHRVPELTNLKERNVPYGSDDPVVSYRCKRKRKSRKGSQHDSADTTDGEVVAKVNKDYFTSDDDIVSSKRKKKRQDLAEIKDIKQEVTKKKKSKKHQKELDDKFGNLEQIKIEVVDNYILPTEDMPTLFVKKKKKSKEHPTADDNSEDSSGKNKKKRIKTEIKSDSGDGANSVEYNEVPFSEPKKKSHKIKKGYKEERM